MTDDGRVGRRVDTRAGGRDDVAMEAMRPPPPRRRLISVSAGLALLSVVVVTGVVAYDRSDDSGGETALATEGVEVLASARVVDGTDVVAIAAAGDALAGRSSVSAEPWSFAGITPPRVIPGPDGVLYYSAIEAERDGDGLDTGPPTGTPVGTPVVRSFDPATGEDEVVATGAHTLAVDPGGTLAYVAGLTPEFRMNEIFLGDIVVASPSGETSVWSPRASAWEVQAWVGDRLVVTDTSDSHRPRVSYLLDSTGSLTELPGGVVAVDEVGTALLVAEPVDAPLAEMEPDRSVLALVDARTGTTTATVEAGRLADTGARFVGNYWGDWDGDLIALPAEPGVVLLQVRDDELAVDGTLTLDADPLSWTSQTEIVRDGAATVLVLVEENDFADAGGAVDASVRSCSLGGECIELVAGGGRRQSLSIARNPSSGSPS